MARHLVPPHMTAMPAATSSSVRTFGDLGRLGLELTVICQKCGGRTVIDGEAAGLRDRPLAGRRFRCQRPQADGRACRGIGLPSIGEPAIGKERQWPARLARHARKLAEGG